MCCRMCCRVVAGLAAGLAACTVAAGENRVAINAGGQAILVRAGGGPGAVQNVDDEADPDDPTVRMVVLAPGGPIIVEASITLDGEPFRQARRRLVDDVLKQADTDGDGKPTWDEAFGNPRFGFGRFVYLATNRAQRDVVIKRYDREPNGLVDRKEARLLVNQLGGGSAFRMAPQRSQYAQPDLKELLDSDGDGLLSQKELAAAAEQLKRQDADDNDLLTVSEAGGGSAAVQYRGLVRMRSSQRRSAAYQLGNKADLSALFVSLRDKYAGQDKRIQPADFPLFPNLVARLDLDENGLLDSGEVIGLLLAAPHVKIEVNLGQADKPGLRIASLAGELKNSGKVRDEYASEIELELPGATLRFVQAASRRTANYLRTAEQQLARFDDDKNGYLDKKEAKDTRYLQQYFDRWDADGDGKVYAKEIEQAYLQQLAPQQTSVAAVVAEEPPSFFSALDASGDNRLSLREMKESVERLQAFDKNGDGRIDLREMPSRITASIGRGTSAYYQLASRSVRTLAAGRRNGTRRPQPTRGPEWFVRMDTNGDGDLTPREFLGGAEKFKQLDTDGDGFIDRKEAEAADTSS